MTILLGPGLILSRPAPSAVDADNGVIGRHNLVTTANISSDTEATGFGVTNLANPLTNLLWRGSAAAEELVTMTDTGDVGVDYAAVARHNFGSAGIAVSVETTADGTTWAEVVAPVIPPDDSPLLLRFAKAAVLGVRLRLAAGSAAPEAAVLYVGALTVVEKRHWVGVSPVTFARVPNIVTGQSVNGQFTGSIEVGGTLRTRLSLTLMTPEWYRAELDALFRSPRRPFFWWWRPGEYPHEGGYAVVLGNPVPVNALVNRLMAIDIDIAAVT
jgi:hypothetical protein